MNKEYEKGNKICGELKKVERAIILAAGLGQRLHPITINTPKPLVRVKGMRIIDTIIDSLIEAGIEEIIIVTGYLKEQFEQLRLKYPAIKLIENPDYDKANNIASVFYARNYLSNSYVIEADLLLRNKKLITSAQACSNYLGVNTKHTDDWCFGTADGKIISFALGGDNCYHMFGVSYWNSSDGRKLATCIEKAYSQQENSNLYWDQIPLQLYKDEFQMMVRECSFDDVLEVDSYSELVELDKEYKI